MKQGDILKIKGNIGFLINPEMKVIDVKEGLVLLEDIKSREGGVLSHLNKS